MGSHYELNLMLSGIISFDNSSQISVFVELPWPVLMDIQESENCL